MSIDIFHQSLATNSHTKQKLSVTMVMLQMNLMLDSEILFTRFVTFDLVTFKSPRDTFNLFGHKWILIKSDEPCNLIETRLKNLKG